MMKNDEGKKYWGKRKPITYHETKKLTFMKTQWFDDFNLTRKMRKYEMF